MAQPLDPLSPVLPPRPPLRHRVPGQGPGRHDQSDDQTDDQEDDGVREKVPRKDDELTYDDRSHGPPDADRSDSPQPPSDDQPRIDDYA